MPPQSKELAAWITALLLTLCPVAATADFAAGVAAFKQQDFDTAFREFHAPALRDDARALNFLGIMHAEGWGTSRDDYKAAALFSKAALLGYPDAIANLGRMHALGRGGPQDYKAAIAAYRAAAKSGFQPAIIRMAEIYEKGELGEKPDAKQAREWRARLQDQQTAPADSKPAAVAARVPDVIAPATVTRQVEPEPQVAIVPQPPAPLPVPQPVEAAPAETATPAPTIIEAVAVTEQAGQTLIRVRTNTPLARPPASFNLADPPRIAFDFPHTATGLGRSHYVGESNLRSIYVVQAGGRTRMILTQRDLMQHDTKVDGRDLLITLTPRAGK